MIICPIGSRTCQSYRRFPGVTGHAPSQALEWSVEAVAKAGTLSIIGVYAEKSQFPKS